MQRYWIQMPIIDWLKHFMIHKPLRQPPTKVKYNIPMSKTYFVYNLAMRSGEEDATKKAIINKLTQLYDS